MTHEKRKKTVAFKAVLYAARAEGFGAEIPEEAELMEQYLDELEALDIEDMVDLIPSLVDELKDAGFNEWRDEE